MIAVNQLITNAYSDLGMSNITGQVNGNLSKIGLQKLNELIATLNAQGYIALSQKFVDVPMIREIRFKKLIAGENPQNGVVDMDPPERIEAVSRQVGERYVPLNPIDLAQMYRSNRMALPSSWNYFREYEEVTDGGETFQREVGILRLDGHGTQNLRVFINSKIPNYTLSDTIYLPDLYNNLLLTGLKYALAKRHSLDPEKKADCETDFTEAKTLIKRNSLTQRMLRNQQTAGSYNDAYYNAFSPTQWG